MATTRQKDDDLLDWQRRLLPYMARAIALMGGFFFVASLVVLYVLFNEVRIAPQQAVTESLSAYERALPPETRLNEGYLRWKTTVLLEQHVIDQRYRQVNATLLLRAWTRYLGFLTGMIMALVGAVFVLGKLETAGTELSVEGGGLKSALKTASPGLVMATLGTALMGIMLIVPFQFDTRDRAVYLSGAGTSSTSANEECALFGANCKPGEAALPKPEPMPESAPPRGDNRDKDAPAR